MKKRITQLDYAKAIGIILVIIGHISYDGFSARDWLKHFIYTFHMPLFFIIAGIQEGIKTTKTGAVPLNKSYIAKLFHRYSVPYFAWSVIYIVLLIILGKTDLMGIAERGYAMITGRGIAPLWFLAAIFLARAIFPINTHFLIKGHKGGMFVRFVLALMIYAFCSICVWKAFSSLNGYMDHYEHSRLLMYPVITLFRLFPSLFFMAAGYWFGLYYEKITSLNIIFRLIISSLLLGFGILLDQHMNIDVNMHLFSFSSMSGFLANGTMVSFSVVVLCSCLPASLRAVSYVGEKTMDIMALHYSPFPTISLANRFLLIFGISQSIPLTTMVVLMITLCISAFVLDPCRSTVHRLFGKHIH